MQPKLTVYPDGTKVWWLNGEQHRTDGPAVEYVNGGKEWYLNNQRHRIDGPAMVYTNGDKEWFLNDKWHRTDGPAIEYVDGYRAWYLDGSALFFDKWLEQNNILLDEEKLMLKLQYG
jgi:hypothetical protein